MAIREINLKVKEIGCPTFWIALKNKIRYDED